MLKIDQIKQFASTQPRPLGTSKTHPKEWIAAWNTAADACELPQKVERWVLLALQQAWYQGLPSSNLRNTRDYLNSVK